MLLCISSLFISDRAAPWARAQIRQYPGKSRIFLNAEDLINIHYTKPCAKECDQPMSQQHYRRRSRQARAFTDPNQYSPYPGIPHYNQPPAPDHTAQTNALVPTQPQVPQAIPQQITPTPVYPANQVVQQAADTGAAAATGGLLGNLGGIGNNLSSLKGLFDRIGGIDGIVNGMGKVQQVVNGVQQMAPMMKLFVGLLPFGAAAAANKAAESTSPTYEETYYRPRKKRKRKKSRSTGKKRRKTSSSKPYSPSSSKKRRR